MNPSTKEQIMHVTPVSFDDFDEMSLEEMKNYDIIVIGFRDGGRDYQNVASTEAVHRVSEYIDLGYSVLLGDDSVGYIYGNNFYYGPITDKFGILLGTETKYTNSSYYSNGTLTTRWMYWTEEFYVKCADC